MVGKDKKGLILCIICILLQFCAPLSARDSKSGQSDSLVRLVKGSSLELIEKFGRNYRRATDATFLHNGTYLICDTALWDVSDKVINCFGNVQVMQGETVLTSEKLDYLIDEDLAKFRGAVVQLKNKQNDVLRTRHLDYNTKDSVAIFQNGAAMRDKDGQVIESLDGTYATSSKVFTFNNNVNMFTDSVFVHTSRMLYLGDEDKADFVEPIDFWKEGNMLSAGLGWYDHKQEIFFFHSNVHALSETQEAWCDSLYYYREPENILLLGKAQIQDTTRNVYGLANRIFYEDSLSRITMEHDAAVALRTEDGEKVDTLYMGADRIEYRTIPLCDVSEAEIKNAKARLDEMMFDPVTEFRRKAAEEAAQAAAKAVAEDPNRPHPERQRGKKGNGDTQAADSLASGLAAAPEPALPDSATEGAAPLDSVAMAPADSLAPCDSIAPDSTKIGFLTALHKVKIFRKDIQVDCDSLLYNDLDSIARFFINPVIWNDGNRQYSSDSLSVLVKGGGVDRASLMSNAFIITQEDSLLFDQIRGTDVMAYFDSTSALRRFDALGGASAMFFLREDDAIATVNKVESKMLSATMKNGELERVHYFESPKNDAWPLAQMASDELRMKGFNWQPERRPEGPESITPLKIIPSEREYYESKPQASFRQTDIYFPGYMSGVYKSLEEAKVRKAAADAEKKRLASLSDTSRVAQDAPALDSVAVNIPTSDSLAQMTRKAASDTLAVGTDSLSSAAPATDSLSVSKLAQLDSVAAAKALKDSLVAGMSEKERKTFERQEKREQREELRKLRIARRDARWAELDAKDAAKAAAKAEKAKARKRAATLKAWLRQQEQLRRDNEKLERYIEKYEKQKARNERKQKPEPSGKRSQGAGGGGDLQTSPEPAEQAS